MDFVFTLSSFEKRVAIINEYGESFYYGDLIDRCDKFRAFLNKKAKNLIFILAQNNIETMIGYLATIQSNNLAMLVDASLAKNLLGNLISVYRPDYIWGPQETRTGLFNYKTYELNCLERKQEKLHPELAVLLSTSGSTGSPKLVRLTRDNIAANARSTAAYLKLDETERPIANLPLHYSYGLSIINSHLTVGATILLTELPVVRKEFWEFFKQQAATSLAGVPYTYEMLKKIGFFKMNLPSLRYITQAGGKLDTRLVREYAELSQKKKFDFYVMYGATEATARIAYLPPEYSVAKAGSIGKAIPDGKMLLCDEAGNNITKPYVEGELIYQGPNVMLGYAHCREDLAKNDELSGVLQTGDIAYFDTEGFFYISGRKNRFLKILGKRISLAEIEEHLQSRGFHCVCGGEDDMLLIAFQHEKILDNQKEIFKKIRNEIFIIYKIPLDLIHVFYIINFPRSSSGKINYREIFSHILLDKNRIGVEGCG